MEAERLRIRVKQGSMVWGYSCRDGSRRRLLPGVYIARWLISLRPRHAQGEPAMRMHSAEHEGWDVDVFKPEYLDLQAFPRLPDWSRFELLEGGSQADGVAGLEQDRCAHAGN